MKKLISNFVYVNLNMLLVTEQCFFAWVIWTWWHIYNIFIVKPTNFLLINFYKIGENFPSKI